MRKIIENNISCLSGAVASAMTLFLFAGCSEWTEPESVKINVPTLESQNPELYAQYLQSLRDYRSSEHKVMVTKYDNKATAPVGQAEHLNALPDSVDYVILMNPDELSDAVVSEMSEIREEKGTMTLYTVSYDTIEDEYAAYLDEWNAAHVPEGGETGTPEGESETGEDTPSEPQEQPENFADFLGDRTDRLLSLTDKYGYDGINVAYTGIFPGSLQDEAKSELLAHQTVFFDKIKAWQSSHTDKLMFFEGMPINILYDLSFLNDCRYIIVDAIDAVNKEELTMNVYMTVTTGVPTDRMVIGVTTPSLTDPTDDRGLFSATDASGEAVRAVSGAAEWVCEQSGSFVRAGICVENAQNDYYNITKSYKYIREAIQTMNPSPLD